MPLKKVVFTTGIFPPDIGGPATFIPLLAENLVSRGIEAEVVTLVDEPQENMDKALPYPITRISRHLKKPLRDVRVVSEIMKKASESDLIFSNTLALESAVAAKLTGKPLIQKVVGDLAWERASLAGRFDGTLDDYQHAGLDIKSRLTNLYRNIGIRGSDLIITPSNYLAQIVQSWGVPEPKIHVICNASHQAVPIEVPEKKTFRIVSVARLIPHKGVSGILKAALGLDFAYELVIIGDGPLRQELEKEATALQANATFTGSIPKEKVAGYLATADLFVLNSSYEGLPHVVLEAMHFGTPVLASEVGGTPEVVKDGETGLLFQHNDIEQMRQKIKQIQSDFALAARLRESGKAFSSRFSNEENMLQQYFELMDKLS